MTDLQEARREYAESKSAALSTQLQEISVAKFEVEHSQRQVTIVTRQTNVYVVRDGTSS